MTSQQHANELLARFQEQRRADIGNLTYGLRDNAKDIFDIWMEHPRRRTEFGTKEIDDISETVLALSTLLRVIKKEAA